MKKPTAKNPRRSPHRRLKLAPDGSGARRVFVLGAGFSYAAGFPLAMHLLPRVHDLLSPPDRDALLTALRYLYPFDASATPIEILEKAGVEDFMSLLDVTELLNKRLPETFLKPRAIGDLRRKLLTAMADLMLASQQQAEDERKVGYVDRFVTRLGADDTVVTFNWDMLLERRLRMQGVPYTYHAREGARRQLSVLKLHGSIDWFHGEDLDDLAEAEPIHRQLFQMRYHQLIDPDAPWRGAAAPFIVPPTFFKTVNDTEDLERIWALAFARLAEADEIHLCGYRLPREDMYARAVLRRAVRANVVARAHEGRSGPIITVVNPSPDVAAELKTILHPDLIAEHDGFQNSRWATEP